MSRPYIPRGFWRYCLAVLALCLVLSTELLFTPGIRTQWTLAQVVAGWLEQFTDTAWLGLCAMLGVAVADHLLRLEAPWHPAVLAAAAAAATGAGYAALMLFHFPAGYYPPLPVMAGEALRFILLAVMFTLVWSLQRRAAHAAQRIRRLDLDRTVLHRRTQEARLKVLEAQIEPHFLFNTLATVRCLYQAGAAEGDRMLSSLQHYLGAALPRFRDDAATLASECALAGAYLDILQIRMGPRLQFAIGLPDPLAGHAFPPMMLMTLVENAIKHGLAPAAEGGRIEITALERDGVLVVSVADNGVGFQSSCGSGVGLVNIRARLRALYGERASLSLQQNVPRGVVATLAVPLRPATPASAAPAAAQTGGTDAASAAAAPAPGSWAQRLRARLPLVLVVGLAVGAKDALSIVSIELEIGTWISCVLGVAVACFNAVMGIVFVVAAITAAEQANVAPRWQLPLQAVTVGASAIVAGLLALVLPYLFHRTGVFHHINDYYGVLNQFVWNMLAAGVLAVPGFRMEERSRRAAARLWTARSERNEAKRLMVESRLNILKARIEPDVLVREIGRIRALYGEPGGRGEQQLENLIAYLQAALPHLHGGGATLGDELLLAQAYLRLHAGNWRERLDWRFDVDPAMYALRFPPMTLLPLIDDALRRARGAAAPGLHLLVRLQTASSGFRLIIEDNCVAAPRDIDFHDAIEVQAQSFTEFFGKGGAVSREVDGNATRVALSADIDTASLQTGLS